MHRDIYTQYIHNIYSCLYIYIFPTDYYAKRYAHFFRVNFAFKIYYFIGKNRTRKSTTAYDLFGHDFVLVSLSHTFPI